MSNEQDFEEWMETQLKTDGTPYFEINDINLMKDIQQKIENSNNYYEVNESTNRNFSSCLTKYIEFLSQRNIETDEADSMVNVVYKNKTPISKNMILYGPPGTGKTYKTKQTALDILGEQYDKDDDEVSSAKYKGNVDAERIKFVTFHQSYGYEDFVEGIKPVIIDKDGNEIEDSDVDKIEKLKDSKMVYRVKDGVLSNSAK